MRRLPIRALVALAIAAGCSADEREALRTVAQDDDFLLALHCGAGTRFSGSYLVVTASGTSTSHDLAGRCPKSELVTASARGTIVSAVVQKRDESGWLRLTITNRRSMKSASSETSQPYGVVNAASQ